MPMIQLLAVVSVQELRHSNMCRRKVAQYNTWYSTVQHSTYSIRDSVVSHPCCSTRGADEPSLSLSFAKSEDGGAE